MAGLEPPIRIPRPAELDTRGLAIVRAAPAGKGRPAPVSPAGHQPQDEGAAEREIVILARDGVLHAIDRWCPHEDGDMGEGLMFRGNIKCPIHGYIFSLEKGRCLNAFGLFARVYRVEEEGNDLVLTALSQPAGRGLQA